MADGSGATLAQLLKRLRLAAGLTQEELAEAAGISTRSVSDLERGVYRTTRKETARLLANALRLSGSTRELFEATTRGQAPGNEQGEQPKAGRLPVPSTPVIGRDDDIRGVCRRLRRPDVRLVTITGLGGVGKTRAALEIARQLEADFPDGIFFVDLAAVHDGRLVLGSIAWCQAKLGDASAAAWLLGQAESLREAVDVPLSADDHVEYDETVTRLRSALDADERAALRAAGRATPLTDILASPIGGPGADCGCPD